MKRLHLPIRLAACAVLAACWHAPWGRAALAPTRPPTDSPHPPTQEPTNNPRQRGLHNPFTPSCRCHRQYGGANSNSGSFSFAHTFVEIHSDGFTEQDAWDSGLARSAQWSCQAGNLKALELGSGAGTVSTASTNFEADSTTSEGVTLPATINVGDTWTQIVDINGHMQMPDNTSAAARNQASQNCTALAQESVSVPLGPRSHEGRVPGKMTITISVQGLDVPPTTLALHFCTPKAYSAVRNCQRNGTDLTTVYNTLTSAGSRPHYRALAASS
jgi:hypothetical protein